MQSTKKKIVKTKKPTDTTADQPKHEEKVEISDDVLDNLEYEVQQLDTVEQLDKKMQLHQQLGQKTKQMIDEVDRLIGVMQMADRQSANTGKKETKKDNTELADRLDRLNDAGDSQITPEKIASIMTEIESGAQNMGSIEQLGDRIAMYGQIIHKIALCKEYYEKGQIVVRNVN